MSPMVLCRRLMLHEECSMRLWSFSAKAGFPVLSDLFGSGVYLIIRWMQHAERRSHIPEDGTSLLKSFCVWLKPEKWKQAEIIDQNGRECFKCQSVCHTKVICLQRTWNIVPELYGPLLWFELLWFFCVLFEALTLSAIWGRKHPSGQRLGKDPQKTWVVTNILKIVTRKWFATLYLTKKR